MNKKEQIWEALEYIRQNAPDSGYLDIRNLLSDEIKESEYSALRSLLIGNELVRLKDDNQWLFQLTAKGFLLKKKRIRNSGIVKKDNSQLYFQLRIAGFSVLVGALAGVFLSPLQEWLKSKLLKRVPDQTIVLPPNQLIRDTIYINEPKLILKKP
jgi:hypothetical protein